MSGYDGFTDEVLSAVARGVQEERERRAEREFEQWLRELAAKAAAQESKESWSEWAVTQEKRDRDVEAREWEELLRAPMLTEYGWYG